MLEAGRSTGATRLDLVRGALDAHVHPLTPPAPPVVAALIAGVALDRGRARECPATGAAGLAGFPVETLPLGLVGALAALRVGHWPLGRRSGLGRRDIGRAWRSPSRAHRLWIVALVVRRARRPVRRRHRRGPVARCDRDDRRRPDRAGARRPPGRRGCSCRRAAHAHAVAGRLAVGGAGAAWVGLGDRAAARPDRSAPSRPDQLSRRPARRRARAPSSRPGPAAGRARRRPCPARAPARGSSGPTLNASLASLAASS